MSLKYNIVLDKGSDFALKIKVKDSDGNLIDFLSKNINLVLHVKKNIFQNTTEDVLTVENGRITRSTDHFEVWFTHDATGNYDFTSGVYDIIYIDPADDNRIRILEGTITVKTGVTTLIYASSTSTDSSSGEDDSTIIESKELVVQDISKESILGEVDVDTSEDSFVEGLSAYAVAVKNGFEGTEAEWLESLKYHLLFTPDEAGMYLSNDGTNTVWKEIPWQEIDDKIDTQVKIINSSIATNKEDIESKLTSSSTALSSAIESSATLLNSAITSTAVELSTALTNSAALLNSTITNSAVLINSRIDNIADELTNDYLPRTGGTMTGEIVGTASNAVNSLYANFSGTASFTNGTAVAAVTDAKGNDIESTYQKVSEMPTKVSQFENDSTYQTEQEVKDAIAAVIDGAGDALDTLKELADALDNDPNFATTVTNSIATKAPIYHASVEKIYGVGNASLYGHLKLADEMSEFSVDNGIAATPLAVLSAYNALNTTITNSASAINSTIASNKTDIETKLTNSATAINSTILHNSEITNSTIEANKADIENKLTNSASTINSAISTLESHLTSSATLINSAIAVTNSTVESNKTEIETKLTDSSTLINSRITSFGEITDQMFADVESTATYRYDLFSTALTQNFNVLNSTISSNKTDIESKLTGSATLINSAISTLDSHLTSSATTLNSAIADLTSTVTANSNASGTAIDELYSFIETERTDLEGIITNSASLVNTRIDNIADTYATKASVEQSIADLVNGATSTLDTLNELAKALGDDPNFATTVTNSIATKAPIYHATSTTEYGVGNASLYGHLKLSSTESALSEDDGTAATPQLVKSVHDLLSTAIDTTKTTIETDMSTMESVLNSTIAANKTDIETKLTNSASAINSSILHNSEITNSTIAANKVDIESKLTSSATLINSTIASNKTDIETKLTNSAAALNTRIDTTNSALTSSASTINSTIASNKTDIETKLTNSSTLINSEISVLSSQLEAFESTVNVISDEDIASIWTASGTATA